MKPRKRIILLVVIMSSIVLVVEMITISILYQTAMIEQRSRLEETAKSQARLIEAVARFNKLHIGDFKADAWDATLNEIIDAHSKYRGFGQTGEFTLSVKENDQIIFLLNHRHYDLKNPKPVPWKSELAEPMRMALSGKSGTIIGLDYRGERVLAAHEPVGELNLGIVAKIDLSEVRAPFIKSAGISAISALFIILVGVGLFLKVTNPIIRGLQDTVAKLEKALLDVKTLRGILPICSFCKKIRDNAGHWNQLEVYVRDRSDADFSHSVCPDCAKIHYPEAYGKLKSKKQTMGQMANLTNKSKKGDKGS